uniref:Uncharacterized protein n=1 Tax=Oryza barthii TaxID=65489 RepID=A0A0D3EP68_9ORYZ
MIARGEPREINRASRLVDEQLFTEGGNLRRTELPWAAMTLASFNPPNLAEGSPLSNVPPSSDSESEVCLFLFGCKANKRREIAGGAAALKATVMPSPVEVVPFATGDCSKVIVPTHVADAAIEHYPARMGFPADSSSLYSRWHPGLQSLQRGCFT